MLRPTTWFRATVATGLGAAAFAAFAIAGNALSLFPVSAPLSGPSSVPDSLPYSVPGSLPHPFSPPRSTPFPYSPPMSVPTSEPQVVTGEVAVVGFARASRDGRAARVPVEVLCAQGATVTVDATLTQRGWFLFGNRAEAAGSTTVTCTGEPDQLVMVTVDAVEGRIASGLGDVTVSAQQEYPGPGGAGTVVDIATDAGTVLVVRRWF